MMLPMKPCDMVRLATTSATAVVVRGGVMSTGAVSLVGSVAACMYNTCKREGSSWVSTRWRLAD
eukprot:4191136-Prymnesium_polylepis.1